MRSGQYGNNSGLSFRSHSLRRAGPWLYDFETLAQRFREMAFVTRGVTIDLIDRRSVPEHRMTFYFTAVSGRSSNTSIGIASHCMNHCMSRKKLTASP